MFVHRRGLKTSKNSEQLQNCPTNSSMNMTQASLWMCVRGDCSVLLILCQITRPQYSMPQLRQNKPFIVCELARFFWRASVVSSTRNRSMVPEPPQKATTFKWARSNVAALWPGLMNRCHRKSVVPISRVTSTTVWCRQGLEIWHGHSRTRLCFICAQAAHEHVFEESTN